MPGAGERHSTRDKDLLYSTGNSAQCCVAAWMGGEFGGEWIHIYVWLNPFTVQFSSVTQSCPTLYNPMNRCSPPGSSVHGILQARILEQVAISFSKGSSRARD